jgi:hypothetical protein
VFDRYNLSSEDDILLALQKTRAYRFLHKVSQSRESTTMSRSDVLK